MGFGCLRLTSGQLENRQKNGENHKTDVECQHFCRCTNAENWGLASAQFKIAPTVLHMGDLLGGGI